MKLDCLILGVSLASNQRTGKPCKGIIVLGKANLKNTLNTPRATSATYNIKISTSKERNQSPIEVSKANITNVITTFSQAGKITIDFVKPLIRVFISGADPSRLAIFIGYINRIIRGEDPGNLDLVKEVKSTELQVPTKISIINCKVYKSTYSKEFPTCLKELTVSYCELSSLDVRWFANSRLEMLNLNNNKLGDGDLKKLRLLQKLPNLRILDLSNNNISEIPEDVLFPPSLIQLDLHNNPLHYLPTAVKKARNLRSLNLSNTFVKCLPNQNCWPLLVRLDISKTNISVFPRYFLRHKLQTLNCSERRILFKIATPPRREIPSLEMFAAAAVRNKKLNEKILPWTINFERLTKQCSCCLKWKSVLLINEKYETRSIRDIAYGADMLGEVIIHAPSCIYLCV